MAWAAALLVLVAGHIWLPLSWRPGDKVARATRPPAVRPAEPRLEGPVTDVVADRGSILRESDRAQALELLRLI